MNLLARIALALCLTAGLGIAAQAAEHGAEKAPAKKAPTKAPEKKKPPAAPAAEGKVGYSDTQIQLGGMMAPTHSRNGVSYEVVTIRLKLAVGENERAACWMAPIVAEKFLMYLHSAKLTPDDFQGQKRDLLVKNLLDVAIKTTDRSFYTGITLVDETTPPLEDPKSKTLSSQCTK
ncbi:MAG: hypothetical protein ACYCZX_04585 [Rhodospirillaceae bacterium]